MILIVNQANRRLFAAELDQMHRHRKLVFVDQLQWQVPVVAGLEVDAYDREDTIYLLAREHCRAPLLASARLLPTTGRHLMGDLFAHACGGGAPVGAQIWEASRFCASPDVSHRKRLGLLWQVFCGVMETALLYGIEQVVFTANAALLPLALNCGWHARTLGTTFADGHDEITAIAVDINLQGLRALRQRFDIAGPVTRLIEADWTVAA